MIGGFAILIFSFIYPMVKAWGDASVKATLKVNHIANAFQIGLIAAVITVLSLYPVIIYSQWEYLQIFFSVLFLYWNIMDACYNVFTDMPLFLVGTTATLDKLQRKFWPLFYIKLALGPISVFVISQFILR